MKKGKHEDVPADPISQSRFDKLAKLTDAAGELAVLEKEERQAKLDAIAPYLDGQEYDEVRVFAEAKHYVSVLAENIFEVGKRLIILKEMCEHGRYLEMVEKMGLNRQRASEFVAITTKFANVRTFGHLNKSKLSLLEQVPEEDIKAVEETGALYGATMDEIDRMPVRELKEFIRKKLNKEKKNSEKLTAAQKRISELESKVDGTDELARIMASDVSLAFLKFSEAALNLLKKLGSLTEKERLEVGEKYALIVNGRNNEIMHMIGGKWEVLFTQRMKQTNYRPETEDEKADRELAENYANQN